MSVMRAIINIDVPTLAPAIDFYAAALGLTLNRVIDGDVAELLGASSAIYLLEKPAGSSPAHGVAPSRHYARHWTPVHVDFVVDDVEIAAARAIGAGAKQESEAIDWRGSRCITFSDPFGHGFCLIAFARGTYDGDAS